jgi:hypothetical protein
VKEKRAAGKSTPEITRIKIPKNIKIVISTVEVRDTNKIAWETEAGNR